MTNRYEVRAGGEIIDTANNHRIVGAIEMRANGRRYLGEVEVTKIWNDHDKLHAAIVAHVGD